MADRCDRCGGAPAYRYERDADYLVMCAKHGVRHGAALRAQGWFTYRVLDAPSTRPTAATPQPR